MRLYLRWLLFFWLWWHAAIAAAVSNAPLQALNAYIEGSGTCSAELVEWNKDYGKRAIAGETQRDFYYRVLSYLDWGKCGKPFLRPILGELQKIWNIFATGLVSEAEFEAKEGELINLFFSAIADDERGKKMVHEYQTRVAARLLIMAPEKQQFDCAFFGDKIRCTN